MCLNAQITWIAFWLQKIVARFCHQDFKEGCKMYLDSLRRGVSAEFSHEQDPSRYSISFSQFAWRLSYSKMIYWLRASCTSKGLSWVCLFVCLSRLSGAKDCTKASFSRRDSYELCPGLLETHITHNSDGCSTFSHIIPYLAGSATDGLHSSSFPNMSKSGLRVDAAISSL